MELGKGSPGARATTGLGHGLIVVARDRLDLVAPLTEHFAANEEIRVVLDRRQGERRQQPQTVKRERRSKDRRQTSAPESDLRLRPFILAGPRTGSTA